MAANGAGPSNAYDKAVETQLEITNLTGDIKAAQGKLKIARANLAKYRKQVLEAMSGAKRGPRKKKETSRQDGDDAALIDARTNQEAD